MTSLVEEVSEESSIFKDTNDNLRIYQCRNVLRSKGKKVRPKCSKVLKRKLKKYKLRQDGKEDQDILDISEILESSLTIKLPSEERSSVDLELDQLRPTNYLFKMGRRPVTEKSLKSKTKVVNENGVKQLSPTTEKKIKTDAFKLLMDSRNKSLGSNSPGKEKPIDETETQEILEKKTNKAKRNLILQKMAESKGSLKKKELEDCQEKNINKKMEKRAERLKNMISNIEPKASKVADEKSVSKLQNVRSPLNSLKTDKNEKISDKPVKTLQLVNMFTDVEHKASSERKQISKEDEDRSKRTARRPVRYTEDAGLSSTDEELHIFTPKKKKHSDNKNDHNNTITVDLSSDSADKEEPSKSKRIEKKKSNKKVKEADRGIIDKKAVKLAPIFSAKSQLDTAAIEAKQKFLQSGVPEKLKKLMSKQVDKNIVTNCFFKVVHIQQLDDLDQSLSVQLSLKDHSIDDRKEREYCEEISFKKLLNLITQEALSLSAKFCNPQTVLQTLKDQYPRYPVYRTYRLLRGKKKGDHKAGNNFLDLDNSVEILNASIDTQNENPEQLSWADKYKPLAANQIIGNFESVKELKKWLVSWTENDMKSKAINDNGSDSSDYFQSDADSKDSMKSSNNLLVLSGPVGSGKTSSVYAIAAELAIKVIEVNASSKRTGKIMLQDLQEATQSHKVNRGASGNENSQNFSQKSQEVEPIPVITNPVKKRGRPKKIVEKIPEIPVLKKSISKEKPESINELAASQESTRTCMSLILIDDADIVFDQDDGFCSAIVQLVYSSKRPVILITSSLSCPHLQRFIQSSKILKMNPLLPNILGTWLDIMCLADSGMCWPGVGSKFLNFCKGDVRKAINCLQFYVCSQALNQDMELCSQNTDCRVNVDDENSNMSWADRDSEDTHLNDEPIELHGPSQNIMIEQVHYESPTELFNIWWSLPKLLSISDTNQTERPMDGNCGTIKSKSSNSLESISQVLDSLSLCDFYSQDPFKNKGNMTSDPWFSPESHSVSELENFERYGRHYGTSDEIAHELANCSIGIAQAEFVSRHNNLTGYLSQQAVLDRKALALDYWSSCRTICRIEKSKADTSSRRNNRFCHYLKSLSVLCKNDSFDKLASSLCPSKMHNAKELS
ncbi:Uncharacterized protein OBRU01_10969, partial [Operophtera brumata]